MSEEVASARASRQQTGVCSAFGRLVATAAAALGALASAPGSAAPPALRGMALGHYTDIKPAVLDGKLKELKELGVNHVSVVVSWSTRDVRSSKIQPRKDYTTPDPVVARIVARARAHGLGVLLFPILDVQRRKPLEWRGTIKPASWDEWWRHYRRFALHYARLAASTKAELYCVGSELVTTEHQRERWVSLIAEIRKIYKGRLLYSANWDHFEPVTFWNHVDIVGITAYHGLTRSNDAPESEMVASWNKVRDQMVAWARKHKRRFVFTEVGYPSLDGGAVDPWDYTKGTAADPEEQRRAYSAFVRAWNGVKQLHGVFFWDWYGAGGPECTRYTPRNKPASKVIQRWYTRDRRR